MLRKFMILLIVLVFLFAVAPAQAQGPEETATPEATVGAPPQAPPEDVSASVPDSSFMARFMRFADGLLNTIQTLVASFLGLVAGVLVSVAYFLGRQNTTIKDAIEKLYLSMPPGAQMAVREGVLAARSIGKFADEVTDGRPNVPVAGTVTRTTTETVSAPGPRGPAESPPLPPKMTPPSAEGLDG